MNKYFSDHIKTAYPTDSEEYQLIIEEMNKFNLFETPDIMKAVNNRLPKGSKLDREKLNDTLRVLVRLKLIRYHYVKTETQTANSKTLNTRLFLKLNKG